MCNVEKALVLDGSHREEKSSSYMSSHLLTLPGICMYCVCRISKPKVLRIMDVNYK